MKKLILFFYLFVIINVNAQEGFWKRIKVVEEMTDMQKILRSNPNMIPKNNKFTGKSDDMGITVERWYYSTIDNKEHIYRGHVAWEWSNPIQMFPGEKLNVRGVVSNLTNETGGFNAYVVLGSNGFTKKEKGQPEAAPPGGSTSCSGVVEIPRPGVDRNGNLIRQLLMKFSLSGGSEICFLDRIIIFEWVDGKSGSSNIISSLTLAVSTFKPSEKMPLNFSGFPGNSKDWIGLYRKGAPDKQFISWKYTNGLKEGQMTFTDQLDPGEYEFRAFANDGYVLLATSPVFKVFEKKEEAQNNSFDGDWYIKSSGSLLKIKSSGKEYTSEYIENGTLQAKGRGYIINNKIILSFIRVDRVNDGGIAIYEIIQNNLSVKHYNVDLSNRWQGIYSK